MTANAHSSAHTGTSLGNLPMLPHRRRLSATFWQMQWKITFGLRLEAPDTVDRFVAQFTTDTLSYSARAMSMRNLCLAVAAHEMDQVDMAREAFRMIHRLEAQYGPVSRIENRPVSNWPLYAELDPQHA